MKLKADFKRIIIFTRNLPLLMKFYSELFKIERSFIEDDGNWGELMTRGTSIAFHYTKKPGKSAIKFKLVFYMRNVPECHALLNGSGYKTGKILEFGKIRFFDLKDPDGNVIQISNRK